MQGNLSKNFYQQHSGLDAEITFSSDPTKLLTFGFPSSDNSMIFFGISGFLIDINSQILGVCDKKENKLSVYSSHGKGSLYFNDRLIETIDMSGVAYSSVDAASLGEYTFSCKVYADQPEITTGRFELNDNSTGTGFFNVLGDYPLRINSIDIDDKYGFDVYSFESVCPTGENSFIFTGSGSFPTGQLWVYMDTDAGEYELVYDFSKTRDLVGGYVSLYTDDIIDAKTKTINFFLTNSKPQDQYVSISLEELASIETGLYEIQCSGAGLLSTSFNYAGNRLVQGYITGNVTGSGGRNDEVVVGNNVSGRFQTLYVPSGSDSRTLDVYSTGVIDGVMYYGYLSVPSSVDSSGGQFIYSYTDLEGVPSSATVLGGSLTLTPSVSDTFTGNGTMYFPVTGTFDGNLTGTIVSSAFVEEGQSDFFSIWDLTYNGTGFVSEGWTGNPTGVKTIGTGSPLITIPANSTGQGVITFNSDYSGVYYHAAELKVGGSSLILSAYV